VEGGYLDILNINLLGDDVKRSFWHTSKTYGCGTILSFPDLYEVSKVDDVYNPNAVAEMLLYF